MARFLSSCLFALLASFSIRPAYSLDQEKLLMRAEIGSTGAEVKESQTAGRRSPAVKRRSRVAEIKSHVSETLHENPSACITAGLRSARTEAGFDMAILDGHDIVSNNLKDTGIWEIRSVEAMLAEAESEVKMHAGDTFLDVGANLGYYSLLFARKGYKVIAVEPMTQNRQAIEASLCMNPDLRALITIVPSALISEEQRGLSCVVTATNHEENVGNGRLICENLDVLQTKIAELGSSPYEHVKTQTLDDVLAELSIKAVNIMKVDVEQKECQVFAGAKKMFQEMAPQLLRVETTFQPTMECVTKLAQDFSYAAVPARSGADTYLVAAAPVLSMPVSDVGSSWTAQISAWASWCFGQ